MSLAKPHPIWTTAGSNPIEVSKAIQQARFLSGRYRSENLARHWSTNTEGYCLASTCDHEVETIEQILIHCSAYTKCRLNLHQLWLKTTNPVVLELAVEALSKPPEYFMQFLLDCSSLPTVITALSLSLWSWGNYLSLLCVIND